MYLESRKTHTHDTVTTLHTACFWALIGLKSTYVSGNVHITNIIDIHQKHFYFFKTFLCIVSRNFLINYGNRLKNSWNFLFQKIKQLYERARQPLRVMILLNNAVGLNWILCRIDVPTQKKTHKNKTTKKTKIHIRSCTFLNNFMTLTGWRACL